MSITINQADSEQAYEEARTMFREYAATLDVDLGFQNFEAELAALPGEYSPPGGRLLIAWQGESAAGCVALRKIDDEISEMKRMYVRPAYRGLKLGRRLAENVIIEARQCGYQKMRLDTMPSMGDAQKLYQLLGFKEIPAYRYNPVPGAIFLELNLLTR